MFGIRRIRATLRRHSSHPAVRLAFDLKNRLLDSADAVLGRRQDLVPPRALSFVGAGDFLGIGREFLHYFQELGHLRPEDDVLDVGCGIGRMAVPLTGYLSAQAQYDGFDIVPRGIDWCQRAITSRFPNFRFRLADLRNAEYNPHGRLSAQEFDFPYPDESFDFVFLTSVFTHMLPNEVDNYISEVRRVLRPGGRSLSTWFLLTSEAETLIRSGSAALEFRYRRPGCALVNDAVPEEAVAYSESDMNVAFQRHGLEPMAPIQYGSWSGRSGTRSFQDICVVRKPSRPSPA
jgi:SAM-dependent methyltransferase